MKHAIKEVWYNKNLSMIFLKLFIIGKYLKIRFKNWGSPSYFLSSRVQKIKNITKIEHTGLFLFAFLVSFFMALLAQQLIYTINRLFNFVPGSFFEQNHLLNLIILGVMRKDDLNMHVFQNRTGVAQNLIDNFFFLLWL